MSSRRTTRPTSTVRTALQDDSSLHPLVRDGLGALKRSDVSLIDAQLRPEFSDSLDLDAAMLRHRENENRWDYLIGHPSGIIALEPHQARDDEIDTVIRKRQQAIQQLHGHLRTGVTIKSWLWVGRDRIRFADTEKTRRRLDQAGILFIGKQVLRKHLG